MSHDKYILEFAPKLVGKPIIYLLTKDFDLELNILRADITEGGGHLILEVSGKRKEEGLEALRATGVKVKELSDGLKRNLRCSHCGACVSVCQFNAFELDRTSYEVVLREDRCVGCGLCVDACPPGALSLTEG